MSETLGLKNVNLLSKEQYDGVAEPTNDELWAVEVETYSDDNGNWYRVYPDGWCEQGGRLNSTQTITFLKSFASSIYTITATQTSSGSSSAQYYNTYIFTDKKATSIKYTAGQTESPYVDWEAKGYIR